MNSRPEAQSRQLSHNSNLTCSNSTQVQETANNAEILPCAAGDHFFLRVVAGATPRTGPRVRATRPRSLQAPHTWWTRWYHPPSSSSSPPSSQCCHSSSSNCERPSCKRTREQENSPLHDIHQRVEQPPVTAKLTVGDVRSFFRRQLKNHRVLARTSAQRTCSQRLGGGDVPRFSTPKSQIAQTVVLSSSN